MTKSEIIDLIKNHLIDIIPELQDEEIGVGEKLSDLGANSIDRAELIVLTLESLELKVPTIEFANARTIEAMAGLMHLHGNFQST